MTQNTSVYAYVHEILRLYGQEISLERNLQNSPQNNQDQDNPPQNNLPKNDSPQDNQNNQDNQDQDNNADSFIRAFLQPLPNPNESSPTIPTGLGWVDQRRWLYLGQTELFPGETICWNSMRFHVHSCRAFFVGSTLSHYWASLSLEREEFKFP